MEPKATKFTSDDMPWSLPNFLFTSASFLFVLALSRFKEEPTSSPIPSSLSTLCLSLITCRQAQLSYSDSGCGDHMWPRFFHSTQVYWEDSHSRYMSSIHKGVTEEPWPPASGSRERKICKKSEIYSTALLTTRRLPAVALRGCKRL